MIAQKPSVPYWHLYTDENGISRQRRCLMTRFELKSMQPPADPQWQGERYHDGMTTMVTVQPVGWVGTWHENPAPQWIIPLSGRWWVESMDGERVEMGPGHISFGEDQNCIPHHGRVGHRSGTVGDEPAVLMIVQFDTRRAHLALSSTVDGCEVIDRRFTRYILENAPLQELATGFRWVEGVVWMGDWNCLLFEDLPRNRIMRWSEAEGVSIYREPSNYTNGQTRDRDGRLISCSHEKRCIFRTEYDGAITTLVDSHAGRRLNSPNDVVVKSDGTIWFTDPVYGISTDYEGGRQQSEQPPAVYRFDPATGNIRIAASDFDGPNGQAFSPDETTLYVAETGNQAEDDPKQFIRAFGVGDGGALAGGGVFAKIEPGYCDGMTVDEDGNIWSSAADGVHCLSPQGDLLGKVLVPHRVSNLKFGGLHRNRLFIAGSQTLYAIFLNRRGLPFP